MNPIVCAMKKILVPTIDWPASSEAAYRVAELADLMGADVVVLFVVNNFDENSYYRGNLSLEIFEEAAQNYDFAVDGYVVAGEPGKIISQMAKKMGVDLILLGATDEFDWQLWFEQLSPIVRCPVKQLDSYQLSGFIGS